MTVERLGSECRFEFHQALRSWPENLAAQRGLERCLEALVGEKIARGDALGAKALLAELPAPNRELTARLVTLERTIADRSQQVQALEAMARDLDPQAGRDTLAQEGEDCHPVTPRSSSTSPPPLNDSALYLPGGGRSAVIPT